MYDVLWEEASESDSYFILFFRKIYLFEAERERKSMSGGKGREREKGNIK